MSIVPFRPIAVPLRPIYRERDITVPSRETRPSRITQKLLDPPPNLQSLYVYQAEAVKWLRAHPHGLLALEQRLGKTPCSLRALSAGGRSILVCPASLTLQWRDAAAQWRPDLKARIVRADNEPSAFVPVPGEIVITNYEALPEPSSRRALVSANLADVQVILDEAHLVKNPEAERTQKCRALARQVRTVWPLTGTPMLGTPMDLWGVLETCMLHKEAFGDFKTFLRIFGGKKKRGFYVFKDSDLVAANACLSKVMLRKRRVDAFPDMPPKQYTRIPVTISASKVIDNAEARWQVVGATSLPPFELLSEAMAELARLKIPAMLEEVERHEELGLPLLVFSAHLEPIAALKNRLGWATLTGEVPIPERHAIVKKFQAGELLGIAITIKAGGVGLTLPRASDELFVSLEYTPALNEQAEDRAISVGNNAQRSKCLQVNQLVADHPLDRRLFEILTGKEALIAGVVR